MTDTYGDIAATTRESSIEAVPVHRESNRAVIRLVDPEKRKASSAAQTLQLRERTEEWEHTLLLEECAEPICFATCGFADGDDRVTAATARGSRS